MAFVNHLVYPSETYEKSPILDAIRDGLLPFKPRTINLYFEFDIDYNRYVLFAEVWFPDFQIRHRVDINAWDLADDEDLEMYKAASKMFWHFRSLKSEPENNILLGED